MTFRVSASAKAKVLDSLYFSRVALNFWMSHDDACSTFDTLLWTVAVEASRDASSGEYA